MKANKVLSMALAVMLELSSFAGTGLSVAAAPADEAEPVIEAQAEEDTEGAVLKEENTDNVVPEDASEKADQDIDVDEEIIETGTTTEGFEYELTSNGVMRITGYTGSNTVITIPSMIEGKGVTAIADKAFMDKTTLTSVTIPEGITNIGNLAFKNCTGLTQVTINSTELADMNEYSHQDRNYYGHDYEYSAFYNAGDSSGMTVTFGEGVKRIPADLFATIRDKANSTEYCKVSKLVISSSVKEIRDYAFCYCWKLKEIEGGAGVESIGNYAFDGCGFKAYPSMKSVKTIGEYAFYNNPDMEEAVIGDSVTEIKKGAFSECGSLKNLAVNEPVITIGDEAFFDDTSLKTVTLPSSLQLLGNIAFKNCTAINELTINAKELADMNAYSHQDRNYYGHDYEYSAFYNAGDPLGMTVTFGEGVKRIPADLFATIRDKGSSTEYCKVSKVVISSSVKEIRDYAFCYCWKLKEIEGGDGVESIGNYAFDRCGFEAYPSMKSVETIGEYAFYNNPDMEEAVIGDSVIEIKKGAFSECGSLKNLAVSEPVATIGDSAFSDDTSLKTVTLPSTLQLLGNLAFKNCTAIKDLTINAKELADMNEYSHQDRNYYGHDYEYSAFYNAGDPLGMTVTFGDGVKKIPADLFATIRDKGNSTEYCKVSKVVIASSVKEIRDYAFCYCWKLKEIEGGAGVESIGNYAFEGCGFEAYPSMKSVETIGEYAFYLNSNMEEALIGDSVKEIKKFAFSECGSLKNLVVSVPVTTIGDSAFLNDTSLKTVTLPSTLQLLGNLAFKNCTAIKDLTINAKELADMNEYSHQDRDYYGHDYEYSAFYNAGNSLGMTVTFGEEVKRIPADLFATARDKNESTEFCKVSKVYISASVSEIGDYAFAHCYKLEEIHFYGNAPKTFGENAFSAIEAKAYYPSNDKSWTDKVKQNYGGTITWLKEDGSDVAVSGVTLDKTSVELGLGRSITLKATVTPINATNKNVKWSSSNPSVASVDENGKVVGQSLGEATITVTTVDGGKTATATIRVVENASGSDDEITLKGKKNVEITVPISFETNGADEVDSYYTISKNGKKATLFKKMHKKGYTFKGWYLNGKKVSSLTAKTLQKNPDGITLEARFSPITYKIKYKVSKPARKVKVKGRIRLTKAEKKISYEGGELTAKGSELSAKGYVLMGWTNVKGGTEVVIEIGETLPLSDLVPDTGKKITLYPIWAPQE